MGAGSHHVLFDGGCQGRRHGSLFSHSVGPRSTSWWCVRHALVASVLAAWPASLRKRMETTATATRRTSTLVITTSAARALPTTCFQCRRPQRPGMQRHLCQQLHGCRPRRMSRCASKPNRLRPQLRLPSALRPPARRMLGPPGLVANAARREQMPAGLDLTRAARSAGDRTLARARAHRGNACLSRRSRCSHRRRRHRSSRRCRPPRRQPQRGRA